MRFGTPKRPPLKLIAILATVVGLGACSEASTGPRVAQAPSADAAVIAPWSTWDENFSVKYSWLPWTSPSKSYSADTTIQKFTINPYTGAFVNFGSNNKLVIPPMTLCDVGTSYGPTEWEKPCQPETSWTTMTVKTWTGSNGRPYARFYPDVRFTPGNGATLFFYDANLWDYSKVIIPYCNAAGTCVDEALVDQSMTTFAGRSSMGGYWIWRKLRHFSGYNVTAF